MAEPPAKRIGRSHYHAYVQLLRDVVELAVRDRMIADNLAAHLKYLKREHPIRPTPTWEEFQAIVADIRGQPFNADATGSGDRPQSEKQARVIAKLWANNYFCERFARTLEAGRVSIFDKVDLLFCRIGGDS